MRAGKCAISFYGIPMKKFIEHPVGKWSYGRGLSGEFELDGDNLTLFQTHFGKRELLAEGRMERGKISLRFLAPLTKEGHTMSEEAPQESEHGAGIRYLPIADGYSASADGKSGGEVAIEGEYLGRRVCEVANGAFENCFRLKGVSIGENVKTIGARAFFDCRSLKAVSLPKGLERIGEHAFFGCDSLEELTLPEGVVEIGNHAFEFCRSLRRIRFPKSLKRVGHGAFWGCSSLKEVEAEDLCMWCLVSFEGTDANPLSAGAELFVGGVPFVHGTLPEGVKEIGPYVFAGSNVKTVRLPVGIQKISPLAFEGCTSLNTVFYGGTAKAWLAVDRGKGEALSDVRIVCTDGTIERGGTLRRNKSFLK